jgi:hypothetical protein
MTTGPIRGAACTSTGPTATGSTSRTARTCSPPRRRWFAVGRSAAAEVHRTRQRLIATGVHHWDGRASPGHLH